MDNTSCHIYKYWIFEFTETLRLWSEDCLQNWLQEGLRINSYFSEDKMQPVTAYLVLNERLITFQNLTLAKEI